MIGQGQSEDGSNANVVADPSREPCDCRGGDAAALDVWDVWVWRWAREENRIRGGILLRLKE